LQDRRCLTGYDGVGDVQARGMAPRAFHGVRHDPFDRFV
jgi:hypothetical protein